MFSERNESLGVCGILCPVPYVFGRLGDMQGSLATVLHESLNHVFMQLRMLANMKFIGNLFLRQLLAVKVIGQAT